MDNQKERVRAAVRQYGLLLEFVRDKLVDYIEPKRKGTPRGEKIGFPIHKYYVSLFAGITNATLKELTQQVNTLLKEGGVKCVSYGLVRRWTTEPDFQEAMNKHRKEFVAYVIKYLKRQLKDYCTALDNYANGVIDDYPVCDISKAMYPAPMLHNSVLSQLDSISWDILKKIKRALERDEAINDKNMLDYLLVEAIDILINYALNQKIGSGVADIMLTVFHIKKMLLSSKESSEKTQFLAISGLSYVEDCLKHIMVEKIKITDFNEHRHEK